MSRIFNFNRCFFLMTLFILVQFSSASGAPQYKPDNSPVALTDNVVARRQMVSQLSRDSSLDKRVLEAMAAVPREEFCLPEDEGRAYSSTSLPIGYGQNLVAPYLQAHMVSALKLKPSDRVLEIGTGSGYLAAVLSKLARQVYTIEIVEPLARSAEKTLARPARMAADKDPNLINTTATQVVQGAYHPGGFIQKVVVSNAQILAQDGSPSSAAALAPNAITGGPYNGLVSVTTTMTITVPVPIPGLLPSSKDLVSNQVCPITYYAPAQQAGAY